MMFDSGPKEKYVRLADLESRTSSYTSEGSKMNRCGLNIEGLGLPPNRQSKPLKRGVLKGSEGLKSRGWSLRFGGGVFAEDLRVSEKRIFDPQDKFLQTWNKLSLVSCILAVSIDPIFFYLPKEGENSCLGIDRRLATTTATIRTLIDAFYLFHMALQFRTAYVAPSSRVFGRGELVIEPTKIAKRYLGGRFFIDFLSVLPIPQIIVWTYLQSSHASTVPKMRDALFATVLIQYIPRFCRIIPLSTEMKRSSGVVAETAWLGAAYYLLCYILASHTVGAFWYYLSVQRVDACWDAACADSKNTTGCLKNFLYCGDGLPDNFEKWMINKRDILENHCNGSDDNSFFDFGIYKSAVSSGIITDGKFITKYCYCLWWGLKNLSTLGQGLETSTFPWEVIFSISLAILGLILFALLIGNMQTYLQSLMIRLEEMRVKRHDTEQWMHHRMLPSELKERVRRYDQYKWLETHGVDEESLVQSLPKDLRRDIKNHLCLALVRRVPLFNNMDERLLDAICERLKPSLYTENTYIVREGDPVDEMFLIIRGRLESETTDGGRSGFFNRSNLTEGDFCGEELLTWALDPKSGANLPSSTRTVRSITEVEGFALMAEELKFVASQFRRLHSRQVQHTFRFYSQQWRTWAACFIQAAWRRYSKRKLADQRRKEEESTLGKSGGGMNSNSSLGATIYVSRFAASALRGVHRLRNKGALELVKLQKPPEPDFSADID